MSRIEGWAPENASLAPRESLVHHFPIGHRSPVTRHSSLELTMNVYTDPALLDVAGAVEALPAFGKSTQKQPSLASA